MKRILLLLVACLGMSSYPEEIVKMKNGQEIIVYDDYTWAEYKKQTIDYAALRKQLRPGVKASERELTEACNLLIQGWSYTMPKPKSAKAAWGVSDGRTTWWNGYWYNSKTGRYSATTPKKIAGESYSGDDQNNAGTWRNGGSPSTPDIYMFLLSDSGGPL